MPLGEMCSQRGVIVRGEGGGLNVSLGCPVLGPLSTPSRSLEVTELDLFSSALALGCSAGFPLSPPQCSSGCSFLIQRVPAGKPSCALCTRTQPAPFSAGVENLPPGCLVFNSGHFFVICRAGARSIELLCKLVIGNIINSAGDLVNSAGEES